MRSTTIAYYFFLFLASCTGREDNHQKPNLILDEARVDVLGWTDAHHVAYGTQIVQDGHKFAVPTGSGARDFLESATDDYLCLQNDFGQTALHLAVREDNVDLVKLYIERKLHCINTGNNDGDTPMHYAACWGRIESASILINGGADQTLTNNKGRTPLQDAREMRHRDIESMLANSIQLDPNEL